MMLLLSISLGGGHYLKKKKVRFINEPFFATIIGLIAGGFLSIIKEENYINNITTAYAKFFLIILLPPIIFESAYNLRRKEFFKNLGSILIFAFLGTLISFIVIGFGVYLASSALFDTEYQFTIRQALAFSSLNSATDPVSIISAFKEYTTDPNFFQIVFGESILNDAVSIVLYDTCNNISDKSVLNEILTAILSFFGNIFGSIGLGLVIGFITAVFLKGISGKVKNIEKIEIGLMVILPWVSYLTAQVYSNIY